MSLLFLLYKRGIIEVKTPAIIAEVITPEILAPNASLKIKESAFSLLTIFYATFAVVGTQLTAAIPITGL